MCKDRGKRLIAVFYMAEDNEMTIGELNQDESGNSDEEDAANFLKTFGETSAADLAQASLLNQAMESLRALDEVQKIDAGGGFGDLRVKSDEKRGLGGNPTSGGRSGKRNGRRKSWKASGFQGDLRKDDGGGGN